MYSNTFAYIVYFIFITTICSYSYSACDQNEDIRFVEDVFSTERPGIGVNLIYFFLEGIFFFILTLLLEVSWRARYATDACVLPTSWPQNDTASSPHIHTHMYLQYKFFIPEIQGLFLRGNGGSRTGQVTEQETGSLRLLGEVRK